MVYSRTVALLRLIHRDLFTMAQRWIAYLGTTIMAKVFMRDKTGLVRMAGMRGVAMAAEAHITKARTSASFSSMLLPTFLRECPNTTLNALCIMVTYKGPTVRHWCGLNIPEVSQLCVQQGPVKIFFSPTHCPPIRACQY